MNSSCPFRVGLLHGDHHHQGAAWGPEVPCAPTRLIQAINQNYMHDEVTAYISSGCSRRGQCVLFNPKATQSNTTTSALCPDVAFVPTRFCHPVTLHVVMHKLRIPKPSSVLLLRLLRQCLLTDLLVKYQSILNIDAWVNPYGVQEASHCASVFNYSFSMLLSLYSFDCPRPFNLECDDQLSNLSTLIAGKWALHVSTDTD